MAYHPTSHPDCTFKLIYTLPPLKLWLFTNMYSFLLCKNFVIITAKFTGLVWLARQQYLAYVTTATRFLYSIDSCNFSNLERTREGGNYSDVLPLKAARRDSISNLTFFWGFESELQTNPIHLESLWGTTLMPLKGVLWTGMTGNSECR